MIRIYFVYEDPLDEEEINLSFVDVPTQDPDEAFSRLEAAASSGELWKKMYPDDEEYPYKLIRTKMMYLDVSALPPNDLSAYALLPMQAVSAPTLTKATDQQRPSPYRSVFRTP